MYEAGGSSPGVRSAVIAALKDHKLRTRGAPSSVTYSPNLNATRKRPVSVLMAEKIKAHQGSSDAPLRATNLGPRSSAQSYDITSGVEMIKRQHPRATIGTTARAPIMLSHDPCPSPGPGQYRTKLSRNLAGHDFSTSRTIRLPPNVTDTSYGAPLQPLHGSVRVQHPRTVFGFDPRPHDKDAARQPASLMSYSPGPDHYFSSTIPPPVVGGDMTRASNPHLPVAASEDAYMSAHTSTVRMYQNSGPKYLCHNQENNLRKDRSPTHKLLARHGTRLATGRDWLFASCD